MEILLVKPVEKLGEPGDVVNVKRGFARNYLFPKGFAVEPTEHNKQAVQKVREVRMHELLEREEAAKVFAEKLNGASFSFSRKTHDDDKLYNSVRPEEIVSAITEEFGEELERTRVQIDSPIEELGEFPIQINVYKAITAEIKVQVVAEGAEAEAQGEPKAESTEATEAESPEASAEAE